MNDEIGELASAFNRMTESLERSQSDLLRRVGEIGTLNATATAISGEMNLTEILNAALEKILEVMDLRAGWVFLTGEEDDSPLNLVAHSGLSAAFASEEATRDLGDCICKLALLQKRVVIINDICRECTRLDPQTIAAEGWFAMPACL